MSDADEKIEIESVTTPGRTYRVNRIKYMAMREALLPILPTEAPGMTVAEAKGIIARSGKGPVRLFCTRDCT